MCRKELSSAEGCGLETVGCGVWVLGGIGDTWK